MDDEMLERIQTRMAFLERANSELSDVVFRQQQEIQVLARRLKEITQRLDAGQSDQSRDPADERPPHY